MGDVVDLLKRWKCPKCGSEEFEVEERTSLLRSGLLGKRLKYLLVRCSRCGYSELFTRTQDGALKKGTSLLDLVVRGLSKGSWG